MTTYKRSSIRSPLGKLSTCRLALALTCCLLIAARLAAQEPTREDLWRLLGDLAGRWEGAIDGRLGTGSGVREYEFVLEKNFLMWRHASVRLPQEMSPKGDYHREIGFFSFDPERKKLVLRTFIVEDFVNQYVCEVEERTVVCVMEKSEGEGGSGWGGRLTLEIHDAYRFDEIFELAAPGQELAVYLTNTWNRVPALE
ncbi:MAG: hypothetical protein ACE5GX_03095 [Thermoanaerobaculia bacterium]